MIGASLPTGMIEAALPYLTALVAAVGCLAASLHFALRDFSIVKLEELAGGPDRLRSLNRILDDAAGHAMSMGAVRAICNVFVVLMLAVAFRVLAPDTTPGNEDGADLSIRVMPLIWTIVASSLLVYVTGTLIPSSLAEHAGEKLILKFSTLIHAGHVFAAPVRLLGVIDGAIKRLAGARHRTQTEEIQEEIRTVVSEGEREGQILEEERRMIEAVVDFRDLTVEQIMTPRTEIEGLEFTSDLAALRDYLLNTGHSRVPVYQGDMDHILGVLYAKDLLKYVGTRADNFDLRAALRRVPFVPESKSVRALLEELMARRVHIAIVIDEFGGTTGLVTFEDILEQIVGEIRDEYEPEDDGPPEITVNAEARTADIDARAYIETVNEALEPLGVQIPEGEDYETASGFVLSALGRIPAAGETFESEGFTIRVLKAEPTRVVRLRLEVKPEGDDPTPEEAEESTREQEVPADQRAK